MCVVPIMQDVHMDTADGGEEINVQTFEELATQEVKNKTTSSVSTS